MCIVQISTHFISFPGTICLYFVILNDFSIEIQYKLSILCFKNFNYNYLYFIIDEGKRISSLAEKKNKKASTVGTVILDNALICLLACIPEKYIYCYTESQSSLEDIMKDNRNIVSQSHRRRYKLFTTKGGRGLMCNFIQALMVTSFSSLASEE